MNSAAATTSSSNTANQPQDNIAASTTNTTTAAAKPASPAIVQEQKLNYAQAAGKATSSSGASTPINQQSSATATPPTLAPPQQPSVPQSTTQVIQPNVVNSNTPSYPNGSAKPVLPPTGPAALNGSVASSRNHSRASSTQSNYRPPPPTGPHGSKPSISGPPSYGQFPAHNGGRNSPFVEYHEDQNHRSPPQSRNGSVTGISMARHGSSSSQSERGQIPPSPRPNNRPSVAGPQYGYQYPNQPPFQQPFNPGMGRGYRTPSASGYGSPNMGQFPRNQNARSPHQQNIQMAPQMYSMQPHMPVQPNMMAAPGQYVNPYPSYPTPQQYMDLTRGDMQYIPQTDQFGNQIANPYLYPQQFSQQPPQQQPHFQPGPGAPPPQMFQSPPPPAPNAQPFTPQAAPTRPINTPMSRSTSVASEIATTTTPVTSSPVPSKDATPPFVKPPTKSSAIRIVNPETKAEITFPSKITASVAKAPERTPSPAVKPSTPVKAAVQRVTHSPAPSVDVERPASGSGHNKSKEEIAEEMKLKVQKTLEEAKKKEAEEEAERLEKEKKAEEERKQKEEEERLERERKEEEERKQKEEEERIKREQEEAERKAEEERIAALAVQKAKEEEEARIAKEKEEEAAREQAAREEAAREAERLAKEREEAEAKEKAEAQLRQEAELAALAIADEELIAPDERRSSLGGQRKVAPPALTIKSDLVVPDGVQSAALKTATFIKQEDFLSTKYPDGFVSPDPSINAKFGAAGFHYNVEFLYQFKDVYRDKPSEDWDSKIKDTMGDFDTRAQRTVGGPGRSVSTSGSFPSMGHFAKASPITRHPPTIPSVLPSSLQFTPSSTFPPRPSRQMSAGQQGGMPAPSSPSGRAQSKSQRQNSRRQPPPPPPPPAEPPVEPLPANPNRWKPKRQEEPAGPLPGSEAASLSPEMVQRKVKSLLNKLTLEKFDKITDQILEIASQSRKETDGRTLRQIIQLTFEKATDEPNFSEMYALFCRKIMETIDPNITDPAVLNKDGQPLTGGQLFRKYLLNRCQEEFERGWKVNLPPKPDDNATGKEAELLSEAYYLAAKAKRQGLGLVQFIGELFKLNMLIEKIMYECIIRLLGGTDDPHPEPEEVESLCRLLNTVGKALDEGKARNRMNAIYDALDHIRQTSDLESRIKFKILDVLDLRKAGWVTRNPQAGQGPKTIQEIHDDAAKAKADAELARQNQPRRSEFGRGDARMEGGYHSLPRPNKKLDTAGDMSKMGLIRTGSGGGLGPQTSTFSSMKSVPSRKGGLAAGNALQREGSGQSSRTATPGVSTPPSVSSTNSFDIFRNEHENKDDDAVMKVVAPDDEVAEGGYYTIPPMQKVKSTASVPDFVVARKGYGKIAFSAPVDLTSISSLSELREIVTIEKGRVTVYPDKSNHPPAGEGLNVPATVTLENHRPPPDMEIEEFKTELEETADTKFISYTPETGTWQFTVEHFSTYVILRHTIYHLNTQS